MGGTVFPTMSEIPERWRIETPIRQTCYLCDGELRKWTGPQQEVRSPICVRNGDVLEQVEIGSYPLLGGQEAVGALTSACEAYDRGRGPWPTMTVEERIGHVQAFARRMTEVRDEVVKLLMWEIGKTLPDAEKEFDRTVDYIRETVDALKNLDRVSSRFVIEQGVVAQIRRAPLGVVLCMGPFNYPLNETFTTLIPALIMGNSVVFKPPKHGVLLHEPLLAAFRDCFPPGVVNTVYGEGQTVIAPLMESGRVDVLAFIGSSRVANILKRQHPRPNRLRSVLGLEAKNPAVVLRDADLDATVPECVLGALSYNGQRCTALKIIFVHREIADDFVARFAQAVNELRGGMPWEPGVAITPLPEEGKTDSLQSLVDDARAQGARVVNGDHRHVEATFMSPVVVHGVGPGMRLYAEEQFGPVVPIATFSETSEPMDYVVASDFGQQISIFGTDSEVLASLMDPLVNQVCRVNINSQCQRGPDSFPFTGRKDSAEGTLSVSDALRVFSIRTLVAAKFTDENKRIIRSILRDRSSKFLSTDFIL